MSLHPIHALDEVIAEYREYLRTEFRAKDPDLKAALERELDKPLFLAQEPFFQAHRPFKSGKAWRDLPLDAKLAGVMEKRSGSTFAYQHQSETIDRLLGPDAGPVVVTTGTGSGKTEAFLLPVIQNAIDDAVAFKKAGLTAVLVYPMNALANDQLQRIQEYLADSGFDGVVKVAKYDRGTKQAEREELRRNPPHILLTNYMMLEYLLVRPADREGIFANHRCRFLVLDEVHTYRGSLGANIALLVRRVKTHFKRAIQDWKPDVPDSEHSKRYPKLTPIGTSATIKSVAESNISPEEMRRRRDDDVREFFSKLTGVLPASIAVFGEELQIVMTPAAAKYSAQPVALGTIEIGNIESLRVALCKLSDQPTTTPMEQAIQRCRLLWDLNRWLIQKPMSVHSLISRVRDEVPERNGWTDESIGEEVTKALTVGAALPDGMPGALRLRVHRFIRGGWHFHRCVNPACGKLYPMGEEKCRDCGSFTAPLLLCRNCGADYLRFVGDVDGGPLRPSAVLADSPEWLLYQPDKFETSELEDVEGADDDSDEQSAAGRLRQGQIKGRKILSGSFNSTGLTFSADPKDYDIKATLVPARTKCMCCGGTAGSRTVITPVAIGTSAAVKVLSEGMVESLAEANVDKPNHDGKERLLVFSDSRQDAAHQARFIIFASRYDRMRRRVYQLLTEHGSLSIQEIVQHLATIGVQEHDNPYAPDEAGKWLPESLQNKLRVWEEAPLLDDISVNAGYRATVVNLGLVGIKYHQLEEYVKSKGEALATRIGVSVEELTYICQCLLDEMRVRGCLSRDLLRYHTLNPTCPDYFARAEWERKTSRPQGFAVDDKGNPATYVDSSEIPSGIKCYNPCRKKSAGGSSPRIEHILNRLLSALGGFASANEVMIDFLTLLKNGQFILPTELYGAQQKKKLLQVNHESIRLLLVGSDSRYRCRVCGSSMHFATEKLPCPFCHGTLVHWDDAEVQISRYVQRIEAKSTIPLVAREHTAQVPGEDRSDIENDFKAPEETSKVNLLACSPTLEMGIDVGGLDAIVLRNIPPRPDNYAQRGGRAGRRTRVGLVLGYARSTPHDQYFFDKPVEMISGEIPAPAIGLGNRDVILRHLNAIVLGISEPGVATKMVEYVTPEGTINQDKVDALKAGVQENVSEAVALALQAWGDDILGEAGLDEAGLNKNLIHLPENIQYVIDRTARQVIELRKPLEVYSRELQNARLGTRAGELVARLLGISTNNKTEADDRSAGYPLRRLAEFGILPGYEFPTEPSSLRLIQDPHEEEPIQVNRTFGIDQFRPDAQVFARTKRWRVIGLDMSSPWNPASDEPTWKYRKCSVCGLRYDAEEPSCRRCGSLAEGQPLDGRGFAGFIAMRDERPILEEEERYAERNLVRGYPQWDGDVIGRWSVSNGWGLRLSRDEMVYWINEGPKPTGKELQEGIPVLHGDGRGFLLCGACGQVLHVEPTKKKDAAKSKKKSSKHDPFGHRENCPNAGKAPHSCALVASNKAELLRLIVPVPKSMADKELQPWGLSLGYSLLAGMRHQYKLDGSEIDFLYEGPWSAFKSDLLYRCVSLTFVDPSLGGTGYLRRIASDFDGVAKAGIEHLLHENCETACYRCLKSYRNQRYHELLNWPLIIDTMEDIAQSPTQKRDLKTSDIDDPRPWLDAYSKGMGSPLEAKFFSEFEKLGFMPEKQFSIYVNGSGRPLTIADFAVPEKRIAIYVDGAAFHVGQNLRRDRYIRDKLRAVSPPWKVIELRSRDLSNVKRLFAEIGV